MAKAHITTNKGTKVTVEGTPAEVALLVSRLEGKASASSKDTKESAPRTRKSKTKAGPVNLISELIDGGFFKKPKELSAIKTALEEEGHYYPLTSLSPVVLRLVRRRELRRIKENKRWVYVAS